MVLNFSISELISSNTAVIHKINNMPDINSLDNMLKLIVFCLQPLRDKIRRPMVVSSGFRCKQLNKLVGGVPTSHHCIGCACDFHVPGMTIKETIEFIKKSGIKFTQLIDEGTWVHISYVQDNLKCEVLKLR